MCMCNFLIEFEWAPNTQHTLSIDDEHNAVMHNLELHALQGVKERARVW